MSAFEALAKVQRSLIAPKGQFNAFGKYKYRSCEDILEAVKPLLGGAVITLYDDITQVSDRIYVKSTARFTANGESIEVTAFARETATKKGMDESQITGSASSYARKYALNGLLLIDDSKDADTMAPETKAAPKKQELSDNDKAWIEAVQGNAADLDRIEDEDYRSYIKTAAGI